MQQGKLHARSLSQKKAGTKSGDPEKPKKLGKTAGEYQKSSE